MGKQRSAGVTFWGIFIIINALLSIIVYFLKSPILLKDSLITITLNALYIVCATGALLLKEWARKTTVVICTFFTAVGLLGLIFFMKSLIMVLFIGYILAISIGELIFFTRPKVKEQFR
jgi:hypothetical protein